MGVLALLISVHRTYLALMAQQAGLGGSPPLLACSNKARLLEQVLGLLTGLISTVRHLGMGVALVILEVASFLAFNKVS